MHFSRIILVLIVAVFIGVLIFYTSYFKRRTQEVLEINIENFVQSLNIERAVEWKSQNEVLVTLFVNMSFEGFLRDLKKFFRSEFKVYQLKDKIIIEGNFGVKLKINVEYEKPYSSVYFLLDTTDSKPDDIYKFLELDIPLNILVTNNDADYLSRVQTILAKHNKDFSFVMEDMQSSIDLENAMVVDKEDDVVEIVESLSVLLKKTEEEDDVFAIGRLKSEYLAFTLDQEMVVFNKKRAKFRKI